MKRVIIVAACLLGACTAQQIAQTTTDIANGIDAACQDVDNAAKLNPLSPVFDYAAASCPLGQAAASLVKNSATLQWLGGLQAQLSQPNPAPTPKS